MSPSTPNDTSFHLEVRDARSCSVIIHRVPPECTDAFLEWERSVSRAAEEFPGYRGTDLYPPTDGGVAEWVVILHFDDTENLRRWIESPLRADWAAKLPSGLGGFRLKTLPEGFSSWFAAEVDDSVRQPPSWKMALAVLFGLYPTVMFLSLAFGPRLAPFGLAVAMLVSNTLSVSILQWGVMPLLTRLLGPWLFARPDAGRTRSAVWLVLVLIGLAGQVALFHRIAR